MTMDKLFDGSDAHLLPGNAELIQRLREYHNTDLEYGGFGVQEAVDAANALEAADKRIAEERETYDRMMEEGAEKLFAAESEYKAMANLAAAYLRDKKEAERKLAVAREAMCSTYKILLQETRAVVALEVAEIRLRKALAQIGGNDAGS